MYVYVVEEIVEPNWDNADPGDSKICGISMSVDGAMEIANKQLETFVHDPMKAYESEYWVAYWSNKSHEIKIIKYPVVP